MWYLIVSIPDLCTLTYFYIVCGVLCWSLFWYALLHVISSVAIILTRKRELVALLFLSFRCIVTVNVLQLFLTVPWVGLQLVIVAFSTHTHLLFFKSWYMCMHHLS